MNAKEAIEAIKAIKGTVNIGYDNSDGRDKTALTFYDSDAETILKALEKQVPMKPEEVKSVLDYDTFGCPSCHFSVGWTDGINGMFNKFCTNCGQAIEWEVVNEAR